MKKIFTKLLIVALVGAILSMILCLFSININMKPAEETMSGITEVDTDSVTAGYEVIGRAFGGGLLALAIGLTLVVVCLIPGYILCIIIILQTVARLVQIGTEKKWKNTISKVCAYISSALYIVLCLVFLVFMIMDMLSYLTLFAIILNIYCAVIFFKSLSESEKNIVVDITDNQENSLQ